MLKSETLVKEHYTAEACQVPREGDSASYLEVYNWVVDQVEKEDPEAAAPSMTLDPLHKFVAVHLENRIVRINEGDWLIRVNGEFYRCADDIYQIVHGKKEV